MKVKELKEILSHCDDEMDVMSENGKDITPWDFVLGEYNAWGTKSKEQYLIINLIKEPSAFIR